MGKIIKLINDRFLKIQLILAPIGSYIVASIPFYFFAKYAMYKLPLVSKEYIYIIAFACAFFNIYLPILAGLLIAVSIFLVLYKSCGIYITLLFSFILLFTNKNARKVKKGKFYYPLILMVLVSSNYIMTIANSNIIISGKIMMLIAVMFASSIFWADDRTGVIAFPFAALINSLTTGIFVNTNSFSNIDMYIKNFSKTIPKGSYTNLNLIASLMAKEVLNALTISLIIFILLIVYIILIHNIINRLNINKLAFNYIAITHFITGITFVSILFISHKMLTAFWKDSIVPFNIVNAIILVLFAFIITIPIALFVNGYDSAKSMKFVSIKGLNIGKDDSGVSFGGNVYTSDTVGWDAIAGYESTKKEIINAIKPYTNKLEMMKLINANMKPPKGILLFGPPGCGKTMFAKAIATSTGMSFLSVKGNEFTSKWLGESEKNLREIFESARKIKPTVIFFDEVESFLGKREEMENESHKSMVTTFLSEMDGFSDMNDIFVIAATNNPDMLDSAAIRPGRFDKCIYIDTPNEIARKVIITKYLKGKANFTDEQINELVNKTNRYSGADLRGVIEETFRDNDYKQIDYNRLLSILSHYKPTMTYDMMKRFQKIQAKYNRSVLSMEDVAIDNHPKVTWNDAPGMEDVKEQISDLIDKQLKYPEKYKELGLKNSKGILMYGPPGCGKTLVSKIIASEYKLCFININGPELLSKNVGESEEQLRKVFAEAKDNAPSVIFFDEFDSIAEHRSNQTGQVKIINQLLTELDGNEALEGVIVIGATNRIEVIDTALRRPGRFDKILYVGLPSKESRKSQLKLHLSKLTGDFDYDNLADATNNFTCADIAECCKKIMLKELDISIKTPDKHVTEDMIMDIIKNYSRSLSDEEIERYEQTARFERK